jgi:hypothetical protein
MFVASSIGRGLGYWEMSKGKRLRNQRGVAPPPPVGKKRQAGRRLWLGAAAVAVLVAVGIAVAVISSGGGGSKPVHVNFAAMAGLQTGAPPWGNAVDELQQRLGDVHLDPLAQEALAFHIHQHLDVYVNGAHVAVPAFIGIDDSSFITEMHTHDASGVLHVESAKNRPYTLGQFFGEWSVRLTSTCLGRYCGNLHWWVNGKRETGDPADLVLKSHQEIVIAAGKAPAHVPASYDFPAGE